MSALSQRQHAIAPASSLERLHHLSRIDDEKANELRADSADSMAESTKKSYHTDLRAFTTWLHEVHPELADCPAQATLDVCFDWLKSMESRGLALATVRRRWSFLRCHLIPSLNHPEVAELWKQPLKGIVRRMNTGEQRGKQPLLSEQILAAVSQIRRTSREDQQWRLFLIFQHASAMRRSEAQAMRWMDLRFVAGGVIVSIPRSKTGLNQSISLNRRPEGQQLCPVAELLRWQATTNGDGEQPVFRAIGSDDQVLDRCIGVKLMTAYCKRAAELVGIDATTIAPHSLRSGMVTSAAARSVPLSSIMRITRHKNIVSLQHYLKDVGDFSHGL